MNLPAIRHRHLFAYIVVTCTLTVACLNVVPGGSLPATIVQTALAGACVVAILALFDPGALRRKHNTPENKRAACAMCACVLVIALTSGLATVGFASAGRVGAGLEQFGVTGVESSLSEAPAAMDEAVPGAADIALFLILCLVTGVFEETLFRGILFRGFAESLQGAGARKPLLVAAVISAVVFGVLHVSGAGVSLPTDAVSLAQLAGKPVEAALFGFVMAGLYVRSRSLWLVIATHAAFNALSESIVFASKGLLVETYVTGSCADLAVLLGVTALLIPLAYRVLVYLEKESTETYYRAK